MPPIAFVYPTIVIFSFIKIFFATAPAATRDNVSRPTRDLRLDNRVDRISVPPPNPHDPGDRRLSIVNNLSRPHLYPTLKTQSESREFFLQKFQTDFDFVFFFFVWVVTELWPGRLRSSSF